MSLIPWPERESKSSWCDLALNVKRQQNLLSPVTAFLRCAAECAQQGISPISAYSPSVVSTCLVFLLTQTNKGLITHPGNSVYNRRRRNNLSDHCSVRCIRRPTDKQRVAKPANNTCMRSNSENTWNSSLVTKSMIIFINLQTTQASLSLRINSMLTVQLNSPPLKGATQVEPAKSLSRDSPSWRKGPRDWAYIGMAVEVVSVHHSSGAVWESRWPSWAVRLNEPSGFRGRKAILNHAHALVSACP